jgi:hypothetical protein
MKRCRTPPPESHPVPEVGGAETQSAWLQEDSSH